jgi:hypothetical protein
VEIVGTTVVWIEVDTLVFKDMVLEDRVEIDDGEVEEM